MEQLRKKSLRFVRGYIILFVVVALLFSVFLFIYLSETRNKTDWKDINFNSDISNLYVTNLVPDLYGSFLEETEDDKVTAAYYLMSAGDSHMMGIRFEYDQMDQAKKLTQALMDYDEEKLSETDLKKFQFTTCGKITKMSSKEAGYFKDALGWEKLTPEQQDSYLFYYVMSETKGERTRVTIAAVIITLFPLVTAIVCIITICGGWGQRMITRYIKKSNSPMYTKEKVERFFRENEFGDNIWLSKDYLAGFYNTLTVFAPTSEIVWIYEVHKNFSPGVGAVSAAVRLALSKNADALKVYLENGKSYEIIVKQDVAERVLEGLAMGCPWIIIGYSEEVDQVYQNERKRFVEYCRQQIRETDRQQGGNA